MHDVSANNRPLLLSTALVLSMTGGGIAAMAYLLGSLFFGNTQAIVEKLTNIQAPAYLSPAYLLVFCVFHLCSLWGAIKMWKFKIAGYYLYTGAQAALLAMPLLYLGFSAFSAVNTIFALLFVSIYSLHFKLFRKTTV